jgi:hypothetical protein
LAAAHRGLAVRRGPRPPRLGRGARGGCSGPLRVLAQTARARRLRGGEARAHRRIPLRRSRHEPQNKGETRPEAYSPITPKDTCTCMGKQPYLYLRGGTKETTFGKFGKKLLVPSMDLPLYVRSNMRGMGKERSSVFRWIDDSRNRPYLDFIGPIREFTRAPMRGSNPLQLPSAEIGRRRASHRESRREGIHT